MIRNLNHNGLINSSDCLGSNSNRMWSLTPNAYDAPRAIHTCLDRPSQVQGIDDRNRYTATQLLNYHAGRPYIDYPNNSLLTYYVDESIAAPFFAPNFGGGGSCTQPEPYVDPMGSIKPHYSYTLTCPEQISPLSWINDSSFFRQDLMARQMAVFNQRRVEPLL